MLASAAWPADGLTPISLAELDATAALRQRIDVKYLVPAAALAALAGRLAETHQVLEIAGERRFTYHTTYFDTAGLLTAREHLQGRRRRFKCRRREYAESGLSSFEVKLKDGRGRTIKHRAPVEGAPQSGPLGGAALAFLGDRLREAYGREVPAPLHAGLRMTFERMTLVAPARGERLTCDTGLRFWAPGGAGGGLAAGYAIVESKSARGGALADRELRGLGIRPVAACSKYCLGVAMTDPGLRSNPLRPLLRRYFV